MRLLSKILIILFFFIGGCHDLNSLENEEQIITYLKIKTFNKTNTNFIYFLVTSVTSSCRPCENELVDLIKAIIETDQLSHIDKYIVVNEERKYQLDSIFSNDLLIYDTEYNLHRHGLDFAFNVIIEFDNQYRIKYWNWLTINNFKDIKSRYFIE